LFGGAPRTAGGGTSEDPFGDPDEEIPGAFPGGAAGTGGGFPSWAWNFFTNQSGGGAANAEERQRTEEAQFEDVFEEMMRDEGMAEDGSNRPTSRFWSLVGGASGGALGFIVANVPGAVAGAVAGNRLGAVRDAKGKSVYSVFQVNIGVQINACEWRSLTLWCVGAPARRQGEAAEPARC
jgi:hypothetical protein